MDRIALIMAAGEGVRMLSDTPKMLHNVCGMPMVEHVLRAVEPVCDRRVLIVGHGKRAMLDAMAGRAEFVEQAPGGWGTGHAVRSAAPLLDGLSGAAIVTAGDMPLVLPETFRRLLNRVEAGCAAALLYDTVEKPFGYGRVVRENGRVTGIVEQKDLKGDQHQIGEINASVYCFDIAALRWALPRLQNNNAAGEYYLTDVIAILAAAGHAVEAVPVAEQAECMGVNDRAQLAEAEGAMRRRINLRLMKEGVTLRDPDRTYVDAGARIGRETVIHPGCEIDGASTVGQGAVLYPGCRLVRSSVGDGAAVEQSLLADASVGAGASVRHSVIEGAAVAPGESVGPFAKR
ncbi:MAG: NTP transferase domain-containing protein [Clostridiales bacterium]|nr:NTP transferase domain-containing protein [Clostridiales bacterium]